MINNFNFLKYILSVPFSISYDSFIPFFTGAQNFHIYASMLTVSITIFQIVVMFLLIGRIYYLKKDYFYIQHLTSIRNVSPTIHLNYPRIYRIFTWNWVEHTIIALTFTSLFLLSLIYILLYYIWDIIVFSIPDFQNLLYCYNIVLVGISMGFMLYFLHPENN